MLFKDKTEISAHLPVTNAFTLQAFSSQLERAEEKYVIPFLSREEYAVLEKAYTEDKLSTEQKALLKIVQRVATNFAMLLYLPWASVQAGDGGLHRIETEKFKPLFKYERNQLEKSCLSAGYEAIEQMLYYLEAKKETFKFWAASNAYTLANEFFIKNASEFSRYVDISESRHLFFRLKSIISRIEIMTIQPILGDSLFEEMKKQNLKSKFTEYNAKLIQFIQPAIAHSVMAEAILELPINIENSGVYTLKFVNDDDTSSKATSADNHLSAYLNQQKTLAASWLSMLTNYLNTNYLIFPKFAIDSKAYIEIGKEQDRNQKTDKSYIF